MLKHEKLTNIICRGTKKGTNQEMLINSNKGKPHEQVVGTTTSQSVSYKVSEKPTERRGGCAALLSAG